jgi:FkbM family methyltransferase
MWSTISRILPNGKFKEKLRGMFYRHLYNNYALKGLVKNLNLSPDGTIFLELNNGLKFHVPFWDAFWLLREQFVKYEKYHMFKKGDTVIDAGANVGIFTVKAAKTVGKQGKVVAIEPSEDSLKFLEENIKTNRLKNVIIVPEGLWDKKGQKKFYLSSMPASNSLIYKEHLDKFSEIKVDTLDNLLKRIRIKKVDFIKMDIEGAEIKALKGAEQTLINNDVKLAIEIHGDRLQSIISLVRKLKFKVNQKTGLCFLFLKV